MRRPLRILAIAVLFGSCGSAWPGGIHARLAWSEQGVRVVDVPRGPAKEAGLNPDDRIVAIDGRPVQGQTYAQVVDLLRGEVGTEVALDVMRGPERLTVHVERAPYE